MALERVGEVGDGLLIYVKAPEERRVPGIARHRTCEQDFRIGMRIAADLGVTRARIMSNDPGKRPGMEVAGVEIAERVPLLSPAELDAGPFDVCF
jgi:hypothetical protein